MIVYQSALISRKLLCPENFLVTRLYTGASTRAVHLDLVPDLSSTSFIQILKSFTPRLGIPKLFISDNGTNFRREVKLSEELLIRGIKW